MGGAHGDEPLLAGLARDERSTTPAQRAFAGRVFAAFVDGLLIGSAWLAALRLLAWLGVTVGGTGTYGWGPFVLTLVYHVVLEGSWAGQTPGKWFLRVRVTSRDGELSWRQVVLRNVLRPVDALPVLYVLGFVVALTNENRQRIGDLVSGTQVVPRS